MCDDDENRKKINTIPEKARDIKNTHNRTQYTKPVKPMMRTHSVFRAQCPHANTIHAPNSFANNFSFFRGVIVCERLTIYLWDDSFATLQSINILR